MWQTAIPFVPNTSQVVSDLTPGVTYQFRVYAKSASAGVSQPSLPSCYVAIPSETGDVCLFVCLFIRLFDYLMNDPLTCFMLHFFPSNVPWIHIHYMSFCLLRTYLLRLVL